MASRLESSGQYRSTCPPAGVMSIERISGEEMIACTPVQRAVAVKTQREEQSSATGSVAAPKLVRTSISVLFVASAPKIALWSSVLLCERTRHERNRSRQESTRHSLARVRPAAAACVGQQLSGVEHLALPANHLRVAARPPHLERCTWSKQPAVMSQRGDGSARPRTVSNQEQRHEERSDHRSDQSSDGSGRTPPSVRRPRG